MKKALILISLISTCSLCTAFAAETIQKLNDWCSVSYPGSVTVGQELVIKVKLTGIGDDLKLKSDTHYFKGPSYGGYLSWGGPAVKAENEKEYTIKYKIPEKTGMTSVKALIYLSKTGNFSNKAQKVWTPVISVK